MIFAVFLINAIEERYPTPQSYEELLNQTWDGDYNTLSLCSINIYRNQTELHFTQISFDCDIIKSQCDSQDQCQFNIKNRIQRDQTINDNLKVLFEGECECTLED